jgi:hypothetical protein
LSEEERKVCIWKKAGFFEPRDRAVPRAFHGGRRHDVLPCQAEGSQSS